MVEQHENRRAFLGQAVLVANLQKANKYNVAEAKLLAIEPEVPLAQWKEVRPLNRSVDRLKATLEDTGVTDALRNQVA